MGRNILLTPVSIKPRPPLPTHGGENCLNKFLNENLLKNKARMHTGRQNLIKISPSLSSETKMYQKTFLPKYFWYARVGNCKPAIDACSKNLFLR